MIKAPSAYSLYQIGLGLAAGGDEAQMRESHGDGVVDWLVEQEESPEFRAFLDDFQMFNATFPRDQRQTPEAKAAWAEIVTKHS